MGLHAAEPRVRCTGGRLRLNLPPLPAPDSTAFLLDIDGTLLDFAPTPMAVQIPPGLPDTLVQLKGRVDGALALITGRPVEQVVALFGDVPHAIAGEHGGVVRHAPSAPIARVPLPEPPLEWLVEAERVAQAHPGALLEHKANGFVLHYRLAPDAGPAMGLALARLISGDEGFVLMPAHMAWEVRPKGADKGRAVRSIMSHDPFLGRRPIFVGDDTTDLDAVQAARAMGGVGMMVADTFRTPAQVRAWLTGLATQGW